VARLPAGDPAPADGALPPGPLEGIGTRPFGFYVHVPFCASRCGYCDFNTYVPGERGAEQAGGYVGAVLAEIDLAAQVLAGGPRPLPGVDTVFFGGGTPTLLPAGDLIRILRRIDERFGLTPGAEVTTEANPESVDPGKLAALRAAGFTRLSLGMQSAVPRVLAILDREHSPGRPQQAVAEARAAGFEQVSLDLIYGTPGETADDWRRSLDAALAPRPTISPPTR
jgi:coproporphyrinogen III oxidase-like Fe-S oxidoreductase